MRRLSASRVGRTLSRGEANLLTSCVQGRGGVYKNHNS